MGYSPGQVDGMSLWQFTACSDGYAAVHGPAPVAEPPTDQEFFAWTNEIRGSA